MKTIIASVRLYWSNKIKQCEKTLELRKTKPIQVGNEPIRVLWYETVSSGGCGEIVAQSFITNFTRMSSESDVTAEIIQKSCVPLDKIIEYGFPIIGWNLSSTYEILSHIALADFCIDRPPQSWMNVRKSEEYIEDVIGKNQEFICSTNIKKEKEMAFKYLRETYALSDDACAAVFETAYKNTEGKNFEACLVQNICQCGKFAAAILRMENKDGK